MINMALSFGGYPKMCVCSTIFFMKVANFDLLILCNVCDPNFLLVSHYPLTVFQIHLDLSPNKCFKVCLKNMKLLWTWGDRVLSTEYWYAYCYHSKSVEDFTVLYLVVATDDQNLENISYFVFSCRNGLQKQYLTTPVLMLGY